MKKLTRRKFLETGVAGSLAIGAGSIAGVAQPQKAPSKAPAAIFTPAEKATLAAAIDVIIPASEGMPSASEVGGGEYLARRAREMPALRNDLKKAAATLEELSHKRFQASFGRLNTEQKVKVLKEMEGQASPKLFATLRDFTYEAYYTEPKVWKLIGYDFFPTNSGGPEMAPFDESILSTVRKKPKNYREV